MDSKKQKINTKLKELGQKLGLDEATALRSKRNVKTIIATALFAVFLILLGAFLLPSGQAGYYYSGGSIRDFHLLFKGLF